MEPPLLLFLLFFWTFAVVLTLVVVPVQEVDSSLGVAGAETALVRAETTNWSVKLIFTSCLLGESIARINELKCKLLCEKCASKYLVDPQFALERQL